MPTIEDKIRRAVSDNRTDTLNELLTQNEEAYDINSIRTLDERSALQIAAYCNNTDIALTLLKYGADVTLTSNQGYSPLHNAVRHNNTDLINRFLEKGADINQKTDDGKSPLHIAAEQLCPDAADVLLSNHADVNIRTGNNETPLHLLAVKPLTKGDEGLGIATALLHHGADVGASDAFGLTPLHYASNNTNYFLADILLQHPGINPYTKSPQGDTAADLAPEGVMKTMVADADYGTDFIVNIMFPETKNSKKTEPHSLEKRSVIVLAREMLNGTDKGEKAVEALGNLTEELQRIALTPVKRMEQYINDHNLPPPKVGFRQQLAAQRQDTKSVSAANPEDKSTVSLTSITR